MQKLLNSKVTMFILMMFYFKPICFQYYSNLKVIEDFFVYGKICVAALIIMDAFFQIIKTGRMHISKLFISILLFEITTLIITAAKGGYVYRALIDLVTATTFFLLVERLYKIDSSKCLMTLKRIFKCAIIGQLLSELIYPNGMNADLYKNNGFNPLYFMALDNGTADISCLMIIIIEILDIYGMLKSKYEKIIWIFICVATSLFSGSSTALICTIALLFMSFLIKIKQSKFFEKKWIWVLIYVLFISSIIDKDSFFSDVFYQLTGKQGFTGRTFLWEKALEKINESRIVGYRSNRKWIS